MNKKKPNATAKLIAGKRVKNKHSMRLGAYMRRNFFAGLIVMMPFLLTFLIVRWFVLFIDTRIVPLIPNRISQLALEHIGIDPVREIPGVSILIFFVATMILGIFARGLIGAWILGRVERILHHTPLLPKIYSTTKQILATILQPEHNKKIAFRKAVLVQYPRKGCWTIGFLTAENIAEVEQKTNNPKMRVVFVPTTPNPTSGFVIFFPKDETIDLDMKVEDAVKMVFSFGIVQPPARALAKVASKSHKALATRASKRTKPTTPNREVI